MRLIGLAVTIVLSLLAEIAKSIPNAFAAPSTSPI